MPEVTNFERIGREEPSLRRRRPAERVAPEFRGLATTPSRTCSDAAGTPDAGH
jgi:hypothetical protein